MRPPFTHHAQHCYAASIGAAGLEPAALAAKWGEAKAALAAVRGALGQDARYDCIAAARWQDDLP